MDTQAAGNLREEYTLLRRVLVFLIGGADEEEVQQLEASIPDIMWSVLSSPEADELFLQFQLLPAAQKTDAALWRLILALIPFRIRQMRLIAERTAQT